MKLRRFHLVEQFKEELGISNMHQKIGRGIKDEDKRKKASDKAVDKWIAEADVVIINE